MTIPAWQHIYTNVERKYSPSGTSGFQTLFYSKEGLSRKDVAEIEARVFYVFGDPNPVKYAYFRLSSGKFAMARVAPITGRDAAGREGRYLAHTLVCDKDAFMAARVNPLQVLNSDAFILSLDAAIAQGVMQSGNLAPTTIEIARGPVKIPAWAREDFRRLVQLALNQQLLQEKKSALALVGPPAAIEATLATLFHLLPQQIRQHCTFDTFFERGGNLRFTPYWAAGFRNSPHEPYYVVADTEHYHLAAAGAFEKPASAFGRWIDRMLATRRLDDALPYISRHKENALGIARFLETESDGASPLLDAEDALLASVLQANETQVKTRLHEKIAAVAPDPLADQIRESVFTSLSDRQIAGLLTGAIDAKDLLDHLFAEYERAGFAAPEKNERQVLGDVLALHPHDGLQRLLLIWGGGKWQNPIKKWRIRSALESMNEDAYTAFWRLAVPHKLVDPMDLLVEEKAGLFTQLLVDSGRMDIEAFPQLVKTLLDTGAMDALDALAPYIQNLDDRILRKVKKHTREIDALPPAFAAAIASRHSP